MLIIAWICAATTWQHAIRLTRPGRAVRSTPQPARPPRLARAYEVTGTNSEVSESGASLAEQFDWHTWQPSQQIGPFLVRAVRVAHPVEAYGIRVEEDSARRRRHGVLRRHRAIRGSGPASPTVSTCCWWSRLSSTVPTTLPACISPVLRLPQSDRRRASGRWCSLTFRRGMSQQRVLAEAVPHFDGPVSLATPGASWEISASRLSS